ncbi:hypothetical protein XENOCAPTIV_019525 [Xenoophorus captivus]|uniref:Homocysteine-responsive endoplasmic reticulum-resident ubiquitin-like domain member 2 protein n=1 Tax=Xenoophorus captivus TaxID=1517983 RepID=A0ABV0Q6B9_9TELE
MDQAVVDSPVILVIKAPNQKYDDQTINCYQNWTVEKLKAHLSDVYPSKPSSNSAGQTAAGENIDWLRQQAGAFPYHQMYSQFMHRKPSLPVSLLSCSHLLTASAQQLRPDQPSAQSSQSDPLSQRPQAGRHGNPEVQMNAQGGEILNEEELNRDWLDWVYTFSRAAILLSIVYFYSSFSRFVMVMMAMLVLYL